MTICFTPDKQDPANSSLAANMSRNSSTENLLADVTVALQGAQGALTEKAIDNFYPMTQVTHIYCKNYKDVFTTVETGGAERGMLPIENSTSGSFKYVYDLLLAHKVCIVGEVITHDTICLIGLPGTKKEDIKTIISHPHVFDQCEEYLAPMNVQRISINDTAEACFMLRDKPEPHTGVLATREAATKAGLEVLSEGVEDNMNSFTRYIMIGNEPVVPHSTNKAKTSLAVSLKNNPGSLFRALAAFAMRDINVSKIESRPSSRSGSAMSSQSTWEYTYFIDVEANGESESMRKAIDNLKEFATKVVYLGTYGIFKPKIKRASLLGPFGL
eukprot:Colp12_sorted_trinity150504_noHs@11900